MAMDVRPGTTDEPERSAPRSVGRIATPGAELRLSLTRAIRQALTGASTLAAAAPAVFRICCEQLDWEAGTVWLVESGQPPGRILRRAVTWHFNWIEADELAALTGTDTRSGGEGLAGRVWSSGEAEWDTGAQSEELVSFHPGFLELATSMAVPIRGPDGVM